MEEKRIKNNCKNCKLSEIDETYHGYTHCTIFNTSFRSDSKCKKHEKESK